MVVGVELWLSVQASNDSQRQALEGQNAKMAAELEEKDTRLKKLRQSEAFTQATTRTQTSNPTQSSTRLR